MRNGSNRITSTPHWSENSRGFRQRIRYMFVMTRVDSTTTNSSETLKELRSRRAWQYDSRFLCSIAEDGKLRVSTTPSLRTVGELSDTSNLRLPRDCPNLGRLNDRHGCRYRNTFMANERLRYWAYMSVRRNRGRFRHHRPRRRARDPMGR